MIIMALVFHGLELRCSAYFTRRFDFVAVGIPLYFFGWKLLNFIFPCSYLIFCVPLNFLDALSAPLQMVATSLRMGC